MKWLRRFFVSLSQGFGLFRALAPFRRMLANLWSVGPLRVLIGGGAIVARAFWTLVRGIAALDWRLFFQGLPALMAAGAAIAVAVMAAGTPAQEMEIRYTEHAKAAFNAKKFPEALACYERLAQMQGDPAKIIYEMAVVASAAGNSERCLALMNQIAAPDKLGYANAHVWHAVRLMLTPRDTQKNLEVAVKHLLFAIEGGPDDKEAAHGLLGEVYLTKGTLDLAERHLLIAVKTKPQARLRLAHLYWAKSNIPQARIEAQYAIGLFSATARSDMYAHRARMKWAEGLVFLEDFPQAVAVLQEGLTSTGEDGYRTALAGVFLSWFDFQTRTGNLNPGIRMVILGRGLEYDPKNVALLDRLLGVTGIRGTVIHSPGAIASTFALGSGMSGQQLASAFFVANRSLFDEGQEALRKIMVNGQPTAQIHFVLGAHAFENGKHDVAQLHWETAMKMSPDTPVVANNLAWLIYQTEPTKLNKALEMANYAVKSSPRDLNFLDTRGHILVKMAKLATDPKEAESKFKQALLDLEAALQRPQKTEGLHRTLAEVYDRLGVSSMAELHKKAADQLKADTKDQK